MSLVWLSVKGGPDPMWIRCSIADSVDGSEPSRVTAAWASARCLASSAVLIKGGPQSRPGSPAASMMRYLRVAVEGPPPDGVDVAIDPDPDPVPEPQPRSQLDRITVSTVRFHEVITYQTSSTRL